MPLIAGYYLICTDEGKKLVNETGEIIGSWSSTAGAWLDSTGVAIGNEIEELYVWAKSKGELKKMPEEKINELGGEEYTQPLKRKTGKSKSDLYWNPKTGDVYSVPKGGGEPELVDNVGARG